MNDPGDLEIPLPRADERSELTVFDRVSIVLVDRPAHTILELFQEGRVRSRGRPIAASTPLAEIADLRISGGVADVSRIASGSGGGIELLASTPDVHCLAKESGVPVLPDPRSGRESCLAFLVERELKARGSKDEVSWERPHIVHRLDRATSGLVLVARNADAGRRISRALETMRVRKEYVAILEGVVEPARATVSCAIVPGRKGRMRGAAEGPPASTDFIVLERYPRATLVLARPRTGRTHQIRIHAFALGHRIACDPLYGKACPATGGDLDNALGRLALHAWRYTVPASAAGEEVFTCPLAADLARAVARLRRES